MRLRVYHRVAAFGYIDYSSRLKASVIVIIW